MPHPKHDHEEHPPAEQAPAHHVEERIVHALRAQGILRTPMAQRTVRLPLALAASMALFLTGLAAGRALHRGTTAAVAALTAMPAPPDTTRATVVRVVRM